MARRRCCRVVIPVWASSRRWAKPSRGCGTTSAPARAASARSNAGIPLPISTRFGGECTDFDITKYDVSRYTTERLQPKRLDRFGQFGIAASISAVNDAGIDFEKDDRYRCGVIIGSGIGGIETLEEQNKILITRGVSRVSPFTVPRLMVNAASGNVSILFRIHGPNTAVATACATGSNAIGDAGRLHPARSGRCHDRRRLRSRPVRTGHGQLLRRPRPLHPKRRSHARQPALGQRPRRVRHGRRGRRRRPRRIRARQKTRREDLLRTGRLRHERRRLSHHRPRRAGPRRQPGHGSGPEGRRPRPRQYRLHQRPRHQHPAGRPGRDQGHQAPSAITPKSSPSAPPRANWATSWAPAAASKPSSAPWPSSAI